MLVKVMNYNLLFAPDLFALYPDAVFVGLIRDAVAVCRGPCRPRRLGRRRRQKPGPSPRASSSSSRRTLAAQGLALRGPVADTADVAKAIYGFAGLDPSAARGVCLQDKERIVDAAGAIRGNRKVDLFYGFDEMGRHMRADANERARARLTRGRPRPNSPRAVRRGCGISAMQRPCPESLDRKRAMSEICGQPSESVWNTDADYGLQQRRKCSCYCL